MATTQIPESPLETLAQMVSEEMERQEIGQSELHRRTGVSQSTIHRIAHAKVTSKWFNVRTIAAELGLDLARVEELYLASEEARNGVPTSRDSGSGCFRRMHSALGKHINGILTGPLEPQWALT